MTFNPSILQPGDALLYRPSSPIGYVIAVKTWTKISHVECYDGDGMAVTSRDGIGVNRYAMRLNDLAYVLRPSRPFDIAKARAWFDVPFDPKTQTGIRGQGYDLAGFLCFTLAIKQGSKIKMWCSECVTRFYRAGGFEPFAARLDADHVAPAQFLQSPLFDEIWSDGL